MILNRQIINMICKGPTDDSVAIGIGTGKYWNLTPKNVYDIIENMSASKSEIIFTHLDNDYPAVQIKFSPSDIQARYLVDDYKSIKILDKSGAGLMKWIVRAFNNPEGKTDVFDLNFKEDEDEQ